VTLLEVLIAITLLSLLSSAMVIAMRLGLNVFEKTNTRLMDNRRVAGAQRILEQELEGLVPVIAAKCGGTPLKFGFFQGEAQAMRLVSTFSLQQGWRGQPQLLELLVIPQEDDNGVRLVVNELLYTGPQWLSQLCVGISPDPLTGVSMLHFLPLRAGPDSFVLADKLAYCRFSYYTPSRSEKEPPVWRTDWPNMGWPLGIRVEMAPLTADPSTLQPITVTAPVHIVRTAELDYVDY